MTSYSYNAAGQLETVTDPRNITSKYFYNGINARKEASERCGFDVHQAER